MSTPQTVSSPVDSTPVKVNGQVVSKQVLLETNKKFPTTAVGSPRQLTQHSGPSSVPSPIKAVTSPVDLTPVTIGGRVVNTSTLPVLGEVESKRKITEVINATSNEEAIRDTVSPVSAPKTLFGSLASPTNMMKLPRRTDEQAITMTASPGLSPPASHFYTTSENQIPRLQKQQEGGVIYVPSAGFDQLTSSSIDSSLLVSSIFDMPTKSLRVVTPHIQSPFSKPVPVLGFEEQPRLRTPSVEQARPLGEKKSSRRKRKSRKKFLPVRPDYSSMSETEKDKHRAFMEIEFEKLKRDWPSMGIKVPVNFSDLDNVNDIYDKYIESIHIYINGTSYRKWLILSWMGLEYFCGEKLGLNVKGFFKSQMRIMNNYDYLLIKLGEQNINSPVQEWPIMIQIGFMSLFNVLFFYFLRQGCEDEKLQTAIMEFANDFIPVQKAPEPAIVSKEGIAASPQKGGKKIFGFDLDEIIETGTGFVEGLLGGDGEEKKTGRKRRGPTNTCPETSTSESL